MRIDGAEISQTFITALALSRRRIPGSKTLTPAKKVPLVFCHPDSANRMASASAGAIGVDPKLRTVTIRVRVRANPSVLRAWHKLQAMQRTYPELPTWVFEVTEVSAGVYQVKACDHSGRSVVAKGTDPDALIDDAKRSATRMMNDAPSRPSGTRHLEST